MGRFVGVGRLAKITIDDREGSLKMTSASDAVDVTEAQLDAWQQDGFLVLDRFLDDQTLESLRTGYDDILSRKVQAAGDRELGKITRQVMMPSQAHPDFDDNPAVRSALQLAQRLLDAPNVHRTFDMLIYKPPGHAYETPWHQDAAYGEMPFSPAGTPLRPDSIQFWIPLDDVDTENGCMQFVPGWHTEALLEHLVAAGPADSDDRLLALVDPVHQIDLDTAVVAEIPAGGATLHSPGTPHYTGPNRSVDRPRRAYIFNIGIAGDS
jgi:hypothetical protein